MAMNQIVFYVMHQRDVITARARMRHLMISFYRRFVASVLLRLSSARTRPLPNPCIDEQLKDVPAIFLYS